MSELISELSLITSLTSCPTTISFVDFWVLSEMGTMLNLPAFGYGQDNVHVAALTDASKTAPDVALSKVCLISLITNDERKIDSPPLFLKSSTTNSVPEFIGIKSGLELHEVVQRPLASRMLLNEDIPDRPSESLVS